MARSVDGINLWGSAGYGQGKLDVTNNASKSSSDTRMLSLTADTKGALLDMEGTVSIKSDVLWAQTCIKGLYEGGDKDPGLSYRFLVSDCG